LKTPNIIFFIQDQMQQQILSKDSLCIIPNIRALKQESVEFEKAYTCNAVCSPSRASLMTGALPHTHGMVDCTHTVPSYRAEYNDQLDTLTRALHDENYYISYFGKWHIERTHQLEKFGIDTYETEMSIPHFAVSMKKKILLKTPGYSDETICGVFSEGQEKTEEYYIYEKAMEDIKKHKNEKKPFCTFISTYAPHDPYCVPEEIYEKYHDVKLALPQSFRDPLKDKPVIYRRMKKVFSGLSREDYREAMRCYYSYCTLVDEQIGKMVRFLKKEGIYDNTLIVFMSDHGDMMCGHGLMMKSVESFEEIYHIPLMFKLPKQQFSGRRMHFYINTYEIAPTVLDLAGCRKLKGNNIGISMKPWITGQRKDRHFAFAEFFGQRFFFTQRIYWKNDLKYVFNAFDEDELYDLKSDPFELKNLSSDERYRKKKENICAEMWKQIKNTGDTTLTNAEYAPLRIAPIGPNSINEDAEYSIYNKKF